MVANFGCQKPQDLAPRLTLPARPILRPVPIAQWERIPAESRELLSDNMSLILQYVEQLEITIQTYEKWRNEGN